MDRRRLLTLPLLGAAAAGMGALSLPGAALAAPVKIQLGWQRQLTDYWCGPASLRMASTAWYDDNLLEQQEIANAIGTDSDGSNRYQMLKGADYVFGEGVYDLANVEDQGGLPSSVDLREEFWGRIQKGIKYWTPPIVNVVVPRHSKYIDYLGWTDVPTKHAPIDHWFVIYGYESTPTNRTVYIIDPASSWPNFNPNARYTIQFDRLCQLVEKAYLYTA